MSSTRFAGRGGGGPLRNNGLTIVMFALFVLSYFGMSLAGFFKVNDDAREHQQPAVTVGRYLTGGDFWEATFENWESEFLQMGVFVALTAVLIQKGAADSKKPDEESPQDKEPDPNKPDAPAPVHRGPLVRFLYENSLSIALFGLFLACIILHAVGGAAAYNEQQATHHLPPVSLARFAVSSTFWWESFQNWQSEFLSVGVLSVLSIYLRQKGSSQSKPVDSPNEETGD
jgi:membrane protein implicated in regulation of membrane protease activity